MIDLSGIILDLLMFKKGFKEKLIKFILLCVKYVSFSILINGEPKGFLIHRGKVIPNPLILLVHRGAYNFSQTS